VPALRDRRADILPLAAHFLQRHARDSGRQCALTPAAADRLTAHPWPGNVRELQNVLQRAVVLARGDGIELEDLLFDQISSARDETGEGTLQRALDRAAADRIRAALSGAGGRKGEAAAALGIDRTTLFRWIRRLRLR